MFPDFSLLSGFRFSLHQSLSTSCSLTHSSHALSFSPPFPSFLSIPLSLPPFLSPSLPPSILFLSPSLLPSLTQIRKIVSQIRPDRQTLMWSATWPKEVCPVVRVLLHYICRRIVNYTSFCPSLCLSVSLSLTPTHSPSLSLSQTLPLGGQFVT